MMCHMIGVVSPVVSHDQGSKNSYESIVSHVSHVSPVFRAHIRARPRAHVYLLIFTCDICDSSDTVVFKGVFCHQIKN